MKLNTQHMFPDSVQLACELETNAKPTCWSSLPIDMRAVRAADGAWKAKSFEDLGDEVELLCGFRETDPLWQELLDKAVTEGMEEHTRCLGVHAASDDPKRRNKQQPARAGTLGTSIAR